MSDNAITLKWEKLEETGLMNAENILGIECGVYYLGQINNGRFVIRDRLRPLCWREIEIEEYAELPEEPTP